MTSPHDPTPEQVDRDSRAVLHVLRVAASNLNRAGVPQTVEETSAGTCYDDPKAKG